MVALPASYAETWRGGTWRIGPAAVACTTLRAGPGSARTRQKAEPFKNPFLKRAFKIVGC